MVQAQFRSGAAARTVRALNHTQAECRYPFRWASMISICNLFSTLAKLVSGS